MAWHWNLLGRSKMEVNGDGGTCVLGRMAILLVAMHTTGSAGEGWSSVRRLPGQF